MDIQTQLKKDMIDAMKAKETDKLKVVRLLRAAIQSKAIELNKDLTEEDVIGVIIKSAKQRRDSIASFKEGGRDDLVAEEELELAIISQYLPAQMSEEDLSKIVEEVIAQTGASSMRDMGKVMGTVMAKVKGKVDGNLVQTVVKQKLS